MGAEVLTMPLPMELSVEECMDLLRGGVVGRVAMSIPAGLRILPVNYAMQGDAVVIRTTPYSELGTYGWKTALAFEVDHIDYEAHQGWSVVVSGRGSVIEDPDEIEEIRATWQPHPWASGARNLYLRITPQEVTGRRLGSDWTPATMMPVRRVI
jgi:nitroimidazol reductase NimA-like FMN-containing flavoprotein (pyridoxamine 5'-phosphate oxidase superfamily)